jgi:two-component sensor histidine kinase
VRLILFLLILFVLKGHLSANNTPLHFKSKKYTIDNGLPDNWVKEMVFDQKGFLWMATLNGISMFDSYQFHNFTINSHIKLKWQDYKSIICLNNEVWASSDSGIVIINTRNHKVRYFNVNKKLGIVHRLYKTTNNIVYYFQSNGYLTQIIEGKFTKTVFVYNKWFRNMECDNFGNVFIVYNTGRVDVVNEQTLKIKKTYFYSLKKNETMLLFKDRFQFVNYQSDSFLFKYNPNIDSFIKRNETSLFNLNVIDYYDGNYYYTQNFNTLCKTNTDLIATSSCHLNLKNAFISQLIVGPNKDVFIATNQGVLVLNQINYGIQFLSDLPSKMRVVKVRRAILKYNEDELILLNYEGLERYNIKKNTSKYIEKAYKSITCYFGKIEGDQVWLAMDGRGMDRFDLKTNKFMNEHKMEDSVFRSVFHFVDLNSNEFLLATNVGLMKYNKKTHFFNTFNDGRLKVFMRHIDIGPDKQYYLSTKEGLIVLDSNLKFVYSHGLKTNKGGGKQISSKLVSVLFDKKENNIAWIASDFGLIKYNYLLRKIVKHQVFGSDIGSNTITGILFDKYSRIWASTYNGLFCYHTLTQSSYLIKVKDIPCNVDGFLSEEYNYASYLSVNDSLLLFGGLTHYLKINPSLVKIYNRIDHLYFTKINYQNANSNHYDYFSQHQTIQLKDKNDFVRINIAINAFSNPNYHSYFYKINENRNWISIGNKPLIEIYNLDEGKNSIEIKAINELGVEASNRLFMTIVVPVAFYNSAYFYIGIVVLLHFIVLIVINERSRNLKKIIALKNQISLDLHDEVGSILTGTSIQAEILKLKYPNDNGLVLIEKNSRYAIRSMKDMVWSMSNSIVKLSHFIDRVSEVSRQIIIEDTIEFDFQYKIEHSHLVLTTWQKRNMLFIIKEALNNVIKHSNASRCLLIIDEVKGYLTIQIEDNGIGINSNEHISGFGLAGINKRAKDINANISIVSNENGTRITIKLKI